MGIETLLDNPTILRSQRIDQLSLLGKPVELLESISLTPGHNPMDGAIGRDVLVAPMDKALTAVDLKAGSVIRVKEVQREIQQPPKQRLLKKLVDFFGRRKALTVGTNMQKYYLVEASVDPELIVNSSFNKHVSPAHIYCASSKFPDSLRQHLNNKLTMTLSENVLIMPDYSNIEHVVGSRVETTADLFSILLIKGAKVILEELNDRIRIVLEKGNLQILVNPGIIIPSCSVCGQSSIDQKIPQLV